MKDLHLTPERTRNIVEHDVLTAYEREHAAFCSTCNEWLRAFAALAKATGKKITFEVPPAPDISN